LTTQLLAAERTRLVAAAEHAEALREADRLKDIVLKPKTSGRAEGRLRAVDESLHRGCYG
jgi:hypothetical protein